MNRIIRWYNTNKSLVWKAIIAIFAVIIVIKLLNAISHSKINNSNKKEPIIENKVITNSIAITDNKSTVSGEELSSGQINTLKILDQFVEYCNNGEISKAYNLLSEDCKNEMFKTEDVFKTIYYDQIFTGNKSISAENWFGNTYKVNFREDALSTGVFNENAIQDNITIIKDKSGNLKLNINGYVGKESINIAKQQDNINITVLESNKYMDYITYTFEITNNSDKTVILNAPNLEDTMFIEDKNDTRYKAYMHEIAESQLKIPAYGTKKLTVKYYSRYSSNKVIKKICFAKIILDYESYETYKNKGYYNNYGIVQIEL